MALLGSPQPLAPTRHPAPAHSAPCQARPNLPFCLDVSHSTHRLLPFPQGAAPPFQPLHSTPTTGHKVLTHCHLYISSSQCCPWSGSISITWELVRNANKPTESETPGEKPSNAATHPPSDSDGQVQSHCSTKPRSATRPVLLSSYGQVSPSPLPPPPSCDPHSIVEKLSRYLKLSYSLPLHHLAHSNADQTSVIANLCISVTQAGHFSISYSTVLNLTLVQIYTLAWP